jgi:hypothetical protein
MRVRHILCAAVAGAITAFVSGASGANQVGRPDYRQENEQGFPIRQDPLFDENGRPDWQRQHLEPPRYNRPTYDRPIANDAPIYRIEPWRAPTYERPHAVRPNDDKPRYNIQNYEAPGYLKPTTPEPVYRAPNYIVHPALRPAYDQRPAYDAPIRDRPEYNRPDYVPQEYQRPREVAPPFIAPPE